MGKAAIIMVAGALAIFTIVSQKINETLGRSTNYAVAFYSDLQARNIANSMAEMILAKIAEDETFRVNSLQSLNNFWNGSVTYTATDTIVGSEDYIKLDITGEYFGYTKKIQVFALPASPGTPDFFPPAVLGAISTNNPVKTLGSLVVDGRDHTLDGAVIPANGVMGVWTTSTYERSGNSKIGGTTTGSVDIVPAKPEDPSIFMENQTFTDGYPNTPDSVLGGTLNGYPQGTLKTMAQDGVSGSQYVSDPSLLTYPLKGVTYVELPSGTEWNSANILGEGILIVHNSSLDAVIKNINTGPFKGLLIADDIIHVHTDILGAVIGLSPSPSDGNCIGNGSGSILYSSEAINNCLTAFTFDLDDRYGFERRRLEVSRWFE